MTATDDFHKQIGCYCEPLNRAETCPNCGSQNNGELHIPEWTLLCYVCEERFPAPR